MMPHTLQGLAPEAIDLPLDAPPAVRRAVALRQRPAVLRPLRLGEIAQYLISLQAPLHAPYHTPQYAVPPAELAPGGAPVLYAPRSDPNRAALDMGALHPLRMWQSWRLARALLARRVSMPPRPPRGTPPARPHAVDPKHPLRWTRHGWVPEPLDLDDRAAETKALIARGRAELAGDLEPLDDAQPLTPFEARYRLLIGLPALEHGKTLLRLDLEQLQVLTPPPPPTDPEELEAYSTGPDQLLQAFTALALEAAQGLYMMHPNQYSASWGLWSTCGLFRSSLIRAAWALPDELVVIEQALADWLTDKATAHVNPTKQHRELVEVFNSTPSETLGMLKIGRDTLTYINDRSRLDKEIEATAQLNDIAAKSDSANEQISAVKAKATIEGLTEKRATSGLDSEDLVRIMVQLTKGNTVAQPHAPQVEAGEKPKVIDVISPKVIKNPLELTAEERLERWKT